MRSSKILSYIILPMLLLGLGNPFLNAQMVLNPKFEKKIDQTIDRSIPIISCSTLKKQLSKQQKIYLLDARAVREYQVSHLPNAIHIGYDHFQKDKVNSIPKDATVVLYCSIGYRSEKIGKQLKSMGFQQVYNLYGGIFEWSNRAYPLEKQQGQTTQKVHAYNQDWGCWIDRGEKVYE